jgi:UDP-glucose:(heptosyl)LPS alpha-1,3-glucosyltransferase
VKLLVVARPFVFHGGVETATFGLLRALVEYGHDVHLLAPPAQPALSGVTHHRLSLPPLPAGARLLALALLVRRVARRGTWDIVQSHERTLGQDVYRAGEGCHAAYLQAMGRTRSRGAYHRVVLGLERRVMTRTPCIVAISRLGKAEIEGLYGTPSERVSVVYNGVDLERFHPRHRAVLGAAARSEAGIPVGAPVALFVGSGFERKGLATAIAALARGGRSRRLLVLGKGARPPYDTLARRRGVADRLVWLGPRADIERWYAAADVVVLPTRYEPFGNVHLEALASGVPVVTTTRAGGAEVVAEGRAGEVLEPDDEEGIAAAMERYTAGEPAVADAARRCAEPFTYAAQVTALTEIYRRHVAAKAHLP